MKKFFVCCTLLHFFLMGCEITPKYYDHLQNVDISKIQEAIPDAEFKTDISIDGTIAHLDRFSWFDKKIVVKKEGFEDYKLNFDNVWTDESWAREGNITHFKPSKNTSIISLLNPLYIFNIPMGLVAAIAYPTKTLNNSEFYAFTFAFPINVANFFGTLALNPWTKYEMNTGDLVLIPKVEFKEFCHAKQNYFISNYGCLSCDIELEGLISSEEECSRCSNRKWENYVCQLKTAEE